MGILRVIQPYHRELDTQEIKKYANTASESRKGIQDIAGLYDNKVDHGQYRLEQLDTLGLATSSLGQALTLVVRKDMAFASRVHTALKRTTKDENTIDFLEQQHQRKKAQRNHQRSGSKLVKEAKALSSQGASTLKKIQESKERLSQAETKIIDELFKSLGELDTVQNHVNHIQAHYASTIQHTRMAEWNTTQNKTYNSLINAASQLTEKQNQVKATVLELVKKYEQAYPLNTSGNLPAHLTVPLIVNPSINIEGHLTGCIQFIEHKVEKLRQVSIEYDQKIKLVEYRLSQLDRLGEGLDAVRNELVSLIQEVGKILFLTHGALHELSEHKQNIEKLQAAQASSAKNKQGNTLEQMKSAATYAGRAGDTFKRVFDETQSLVNTQEGFSDDIGYALAALDQADSLLRSKQTEQIFMFNNTPADEWESRNNTLSLEVDTAKEQLKDTEVTVKHTLLQIQNELLNQ